MPQALVFIINMKKMNQPKPDPHTNFPTEHIHEQLAYYIALILIRLGKIQNFINTYKLSAY